MPKEIEVNGEVIEFPDDMPDSEIEAVLSREFGKQDEFSPVSDSRTENFLAGIGQGITDIALGAKQRASDIASFLPGSPLTAGARSQREGLQQEAQEKRAIDAPLLSTGAGFAGSLTGNIAATLPFGLGAGTIPRAIALGAGEGALLPTTSGEETATNIGIGGAGGAAGQLAARGIGRLFQPLTGRLSQNADEAARLLRREGVELDVPQRVGSEGAQRVRSALADNPLTASGQRRFADKQREQFTKAVLKTIGENADEASPAILNSARNRFNDILDAAVNQNPAFADRTLVAELNAINQRAFAETGDEGIARAISKNIDNLLSSVNVQGQIPPGAFTGVRSSLSKLSTKTPLAREAQEAMFDALERSGGSKEGLRKAIAHWRNLNIIEDSIDKGVDKHISPLRLSGVLARKRNRALSLRRLGHESSKKLADLAEAGRTILPETIGQSGTTPRRFAGEALLAGGGFAGGLAAGQDVEGALGVAAGAALTPLALQKLFLNQGLAGDLLARGLPGAATANSAIPQALIRQGVISGGLLGQ